MNRKPDRLPREARQLLAPFFPGFNLGRVRIYERIPWFVLGKPVGYANRHKIYLAPGAYQTASVGGIALLAHEIAHCRQYSEYGTWRFRATYLFSYFKNRWRGMSRREAYLNIPFEIEAREIEAKVYSELRRMRSRQSEFVSRKGATA